MKSRLFSVVLPVTALLGLAVASFAQVARNAPAFNSELRSESVLGDWRVTVPEALYDKGQYNLQLGIGYLRASTLISSLFEEGALPPDQAFGAWLNRSAELFEASISASPGNVNAWTGIAEANALLGATEDAVTALRVSWELAPRNISEARPRGQVARSLIEEGVLTSESDRSAIASDLAVLQRHDARYIERLRDGASDAFLSIIDAQRTASDNGG